MFIFFLGWVGGWVSAGVGVDLFCVHFDQFLFSFEIRNILIERAETTNEVQIYASKLRGSNANKPNEMNLGKRKQIVNIFVH